jgi:Fe2+ or Zn2+ uptake regulation protein
MSLRDRVIQSLEFLKPCSCGHLWKVMMRDLTSERIEREQVYRVLYQLSRDGIVDHFGRGQYRLTGEGSQKSQRFRVVRPSLFEV